MIVYLEIEGRPPEEVLQKISAFYKEIFNAPDDENLVQRINSAEGLLTILALSDEKPVGLKIGYAIDSETFYSWLGGVGVDFRRQGIARELMRRQHEFCRRKGFSKIRTKTKNSFRAMLIFNIESGFDIVETYRGRHGQTKIVMEKRLN